MPRLQQGSELNNEQLWGDAQQSFNWRDRLSRLVSYKAMNVPLDDAMNINQHSGWGWKELAVLLAAGLVGAWLWLGREKQPSSPPPPEPAPVSDSDTVRTIELRAGPDTGGSFQPPPPPG